MQHQALSRLVYSPPGLLKPDPSSPRHGHSLIPLAPPPRCCSGQDTHEASNVLLTVSGAGGAVEVKSLDISKVSQPRPVCDLAPYLPPRQADRI